MTPEQFLVKTCAPTLVGLKPANLINFRDLEQYADVLHLVEELAHAGILAEPFCRCTHHALLLVYNEERLRAHVNRPEIRHFLRAYGYPETCEDLTCYLAHLSHRMESTKPEFPHEVGVFLGYPLEDVNGFIRYRGQCEKMCGYWKVYGDCNEAREVFHQFSQVELSLMARLSQGNALAQLLR